MVPVEAPPIELLLETLLFVADGPVEIARLQRALEADRPTVEAGLERLAASFRARGIRLQRKDDSVTLASAPEAARYVERFLGLGETGRLSGPALETLAIVAYRQPATRTQIEAVRGVGAEYAIRSLLARSLIQEVGRAETVGRPILYGTTFEFLQYFGLESLDQLPTLPDGRFASLDAPRALVEARERLSRPGPSSPPGPAP
ncbi:MAG TPA: SMC-Scp complex subunit ScpB [Chloroflexota bacterium]|nr:SMC-Scp complex subunit ScpB [Chloroflexota bacterium]